MKSQRRPTMQSAHRILVSLFAALNAIMLYLFLLHLPFGYDSLALSIRGWSGAMPRIGNVAAFSGVLAVLAVLMSVRLGSVWKTRLVYLTWRYAHPAYTAFFGGKEPSFDRKPLRVAHPEIKDSAYNPEVQYRLWQELGSKHADKPAVAGTRAGWLLMRDLLVISELFMLIFLICWPFNEGVKVVTAFNYLYIFGVQVLFLMFSARGIGRRMVFNILALEIGIPEQPKKKKNKRWMSR